MCKIQVHKGIMQCEVPPIDERRQFGVSCGYMPVQTKNMTFTLYKLNKRW